MTLYATYDEVKAELKATDSITAAEKAKLLRDIRAASRRLDLEFGSRRELFAPVKETRKIPVENWRVNSALGTFRLSDPLVELTSVTLGTTALTLTTQVVAYPDAAQPPFSALRLVWDSYSGDWYTDDANAPLFVTVAGIWAAHRDYTNAWWSADTLAANITSSAPTFTVSDIDGTDLYGLTPRISIGNLVKMGDELMEVTNTDISTNTGTARRGVNGTTAAAHTAGDAVYVFQVEEPVKRAVARQAAMMFARRGAYTTVEVQGMSEVRFPADLLTEVRAIMQDLQYVY